MQDPEAMLYASVDASSSDTNASKLACANVQLSIRIKIKVFNRLL